MLRAPAARWCPFSVSTGFVAVFLFGPVEYSEVYCGVVLEEHCVDASIGCFFLSFFSYFLIGIFFSIPLYISPFLFQYARCMVRSFYGTVSFVFFYQAFLVVLLSFFT